MNYREVLFHTQTAMAGAAAASNEMIEKLKEEMNDLKLIKADLICSKNEMMLYCDAKCQRIYELELELKELK